MADVSNTEKAQVVHRSDGVNGVDGVNRVNGGNPMNGVHGHDGVNGGSVMNGDLKKNPDTVPDHSEAMAAQIAAMSPEEYSQAERKLLRKMDLNLIPWMT